MSKSKAFRPPTKMYNERKRRTTSDSPKKKSINSFNLAKSQKLTKRHVINKEKNPSHHIINRPYISPRTPHLGEPKADLGRNDPRSLPKKSLLSPFFFVPP